MNNSKSVKIALDIKNDYTHNMVQNLFENSSLDRAELLELISRSSTDELGQYVTGAYILDLFTESSKSIASLDLSYDTVKELTACAARVYHHNITANGMTPDYAKNLFCRMIAAYLIYLCANEHDCELDVRKLSSPPSSVDDEKYWSSNLEIRIGKQEQIDFLVSAIEGLKPNALSGSECYSVAPLAAAYKKATGIDLTEMGFCDITF